MATVDLVTWEPELAMEPDSEHVFAGAVLVGVADAGRLRAVALEVRTVAALGIDEIEAVGLTLRRDPVFLGL